MIMDNERAKRILVWVAWITALTLFALCGVAVNNLRIAHIDGGIEPAAILHTPVPPERLPVSAMDTLPSIHIYLGASGRKGWPQMYWGLPQYIIGGCFYGDSMETSYGTGTLFREKRVDPRSEPIQEAIIHGMDPAPKANQCYSVKAYFLGYHDEVALGHHNEIAEFDAISFEPLVW